MPLILLVLIILFSVPVLSENTDQPIVDVITVKHESKISTGKPKNETAAKITQPPAPSFIKIPSSNTASNPRNNSHTSTKTSRTPALDLAEQKRMANSAEKTVGIARWQFWVSVIGIVLIFLTLWETRRAASAAHIAAKAAQDVTRQNRAWIAITDKSDNWITTTDEGGYEITQRIKNTGGTPGINVRSCVTFHFFPATEPLPEFKPGDWNPIGILPPNGSHLGHIIIPAESNVLKDENSRCILHTLIEYETIYSVQQVCVTEIVEEIELIKQGDWVFDYGVFNNADRMASGESSVKTRRTEFGIYPVGSQQRAT